MFNLINQNRTGTVNYEELKNFMYSKGLYAKKEIMYGKEIIKLIIKPYLDALIRIIKD